MTAGALLLCAGKGERLGLAAPKALAPLAGRALFTWALEALQRATAVDAIVVVGPARRLEESLAAAGCGAAKIVAWIDGGAERQDSVSRSLGALPERCTHVVVHDAARALVTPELTDRVIGDALAHGAAIAAAPLVDTLKRATLHSVDATVPRQGLWCAQTPQAFRRDWLVAAHAQGGARATDDAALVEALGHPVHVTESREVNFKITTPQDLELAEAWLTRSSARI